MVRMCSILMIFWIWTIMIQKVRKKFSKSTIRNKLSNLEYLERMADEIADQLNQINQINKVTPVMLIVTKSIFLTLLQGVETKIKEEVITINKMNMRCRTCIHLYKDIVLRDPMEQEGNIHLCQIHQTQVNNQVFLIKKQLCHLVEFTRHQVQNSTVLNKLKFLILTIFHLRAKILAWKINFNLKNRCQFHLQGILVI